MTIIVIIIIITFTAIFTLDVRSIQQRRQVLKNKIKAIYWGRTELHGSVDWHSSPQFLAQDIGEFNTRLHTSLQCIKFLFENGLFVKQF